MQDTLWLSAKHIYFNFENLCVFFLAIGVSVQLSLLLDFTLYANKEQYFCCYSIINSAYVYRFTSGTNFLWRQFGCPFDGMTA